MLSDFFKHQINSFKVFGPCILPSGHSVSRTLETKKYPSLLWLQKCTKFPTQSTKYIESNNFSAEVTQILSQSWCLFLFMRCLWGLSVQLVLLCIRKSCSCWCWSSISLLELARIRTVWMWAPTACMIEDMNVLLMAFWLEKRETVISLTASSPRMIHSWDIEELLLSFLLPQMATQVFFFFFYLEVVFCSRIIIAAWPKLWPCWRNVWFDLRNDARLCSVQKLKWFSRSLRCF